MNTTNTSAASTAAPAPRPLLRLGLWAAVLAALGAVFAAYFNPQLVFELASRAWACF
jgi:hypothetical protein